MTHTIRELRCPPELTAPRPAPPAPARGAILKGNEAGLAYVAEIAAFATALLKRLGDGAAQCPQTSE